MDNVIELPVAKPKPKLCASQAATAVKKQTPKEREIASTTRELWAKANTLVILLENTGKVADILQNMADQFKRLSENDGGPKEA